MRKNMKYFVFFISILTFLIGTSLLIRYYQSGQESFEELGNLREIKYTAIKPSFSDVKNEKKTDIQGKEGIEKISAETDIEILFEYRDLYQKNSDLVGWLNIPNTKIDYPVMQRERDFYLNHDFRKQPSTIGLPFLDNGCDINQDKQNIVIYAHNMKNGAMFHGLFEYLDTSYREKNPILYFDTLYEKREYEIVDVLQFVDQDFQEEIKAQEETLILVTCSYHKENGRLAIFARQKQ